MTKILLVDDIKENLRALEALLRRKDIDIFKAKSGSEALDLMMTHEFALALIDVHMPEMSGFELAEFMRGANRTKNIPIIFVTATAKDQRSLFKGYESGAVDFLSKPLDTHAVKNKVNIFIELYRQKKEIKVTEAKFRGLLESAPDAMVIVSESGRIELINKQTEIIFGYKRSELIGQPMEILMPARFRHAHVQHRSGYVGTPSLRPMGRGLDLFGLRKNGTEFPIDISLSPFETESGKLISSAIRDITVRHALEFEKEELLIKLKKIQVELEQAVHIRDEFMSMASHELKTPLTTMFLQTQMRLRNLRKADPSLFTVERLTKMFTDDQKQMEKLTHLIDDMLDIARITSGKLSVRVARFDLCELVRDLVERSSDQFLAAGCPIKMEVCDKAFGNWDRFRIEQVIINLLTNAMRYGSGKSILIGVKETKNGAQIIVRDQGRGIAKENQVRIFDKFERAVSGSEIRGLGLGLYIVKEILESHHGSIRVESELGNGAAFIVELPVC